MCAPQHRSRVRPRSGRTCARNAPVPAEPVLPYGDNVRGNSNCTGTIGHRHGSVVPQWVGSPPPAAWPLLTLAPAVHRGRRSPRPPHLLQPATPNPHTSTRTGTLKGPPGAACGDLDAAEPARLTGRRFGGGDASNPRRQQGQLGRHTPRLGAPAPTQQWVRLRRGTGYSMEAASPQRVSLGTGWAIPAGKCGGQCVA